MPNLGCCGAPRPTLADLFARADALPSTTRAGRVARARLAYSLVAARAAQSGNQPVYARAMSGLRGLGAEGDGISTHGTTIVDPAIAAAQAEPITASLRSIFNQAAPAASATYRQVQSVVGILTGIARLGTGIAGVVPGADQNAIRTINFILSWIATLFQGTAPSIPTLDANAVQGLVGFCQFKDPIRGVIGAALGAASAAISIPAATGGTVDASALAALETIRVWTDGILNGICNIAQVRAAIAAQTAAVGAAEIAARDAACRAASPMSRYSVAANKCQCVAGYVDRGDAREGCYPVATAPAGGGGPITLTAAQRRALLTPAGSLTPTQRALIRLIPVTMVPGTLDPVTLCAPGEVGNPCNSGICDGGQYAGTTCVNGVPTKASSGAAAVVPVAIGAAALWFLFK